MLHRQNGKQTQNFWDFSEYLENKARKQGIPVHGQFELTPLCNLNCGMCYVHLNAEQMGGQSLLTVEQWKEAARQAAEAGMLSASLTGGECLTYPGFDELYLYLQNLGCFVDVLTNGVLLDEKRLRFFREHPPASIQVTLYGPNEDAYERVTGRRVFHTVLENLQRVREAKIPLIITITPNRALGEDAFDTIRTAFGLTKNIVINTSLFTPPGQSWRTGARDEPEAEYYARILRFYSELQGKEVREYPENELPAPGVPCDSCGDHEIICGGGRSGFVMNWKGEMLICNRMEPRTFPLREGFAEAWRKIHEAAVNWPRPAACRGCAYEEVCGYCPAEASKYARPGERPEALCERTRYMVSRGILNIPVCD